MILERITIIGMTNYVYFRRFVKLKIYDLGDLFDESIKKHLLI